ncbi:MAG: hypothetical protein ACI4F7_03370 [Acutalibacteraceae bacterium]
MKIKKALDIIFAASVALFICGIILGLSCRAYCTRGNENYSELQPESFVPDVIETALHNETYRQIYVCYNDANCVNVYSESGKFLWAVATPYIRNSYFELQDGKLIIYGDGAYIYSAENGEFLKFEDEEKLNLSYIWQKEGVNELSESGFYFDDHQVYKADSKGELITIVSRPWWHKIFDFEFGFFIALIGAAGIGATVFLGKRRDYKSANNKASFKNRKVRVIKKYLIITSVIQLIYAVCDIIAGFFGGFLCIGIIPVALHFIISNVVIWNMLDRLSVKKETVQVLDYWKTVEISTFIAAFVSVILAVGIAE